MEDLNLHGLSPTNVKIIGCSPKKLEHFCSKEALEFGQVLFFKKSEAMIKVEKL